MSTKEILCFTFIKGIIVLTVGSNYMHKEYTCDYVHARMHTHTHTHTLTPFCFKKLRAI